MKKTLLIGIMLGVLFLISAQAVKAENASEEKNVLVKIPEFKDAGNKICPVSGEKIDEKNKATYEYEGKIYNFCCAMCIDSFKSDPQKYIKKVEEEFKAREGVSKDE